MSDSDYLQAAAESSSDTPEAVDGDGLVPSLSTRQTALIVGGVVVGVLVLLWLRRRGSADESGTETGRDIPAQVTDEGAEGGESDETDGEAVTGTIEVPPNPNDPMAADEAVMEAFRERGRITTMTEED